MDDYPPLFTRGNSFYIVGDDYVEGNEDKHWYRQGSPIADKYSSLISNGHPFNIVGGNFEESGDSCSCHSYRPP